MVVFKRKLSDALIRSLTEPGKHADGEVPGLYLEVRASNKVGKSSSKVWRLKYRLHGKENRFSIGAYPDIGLKEARDIARSARGSGAWTRIWRESALLLRHGVSVRLPASVGLQVITWDLAREEKMLGED